MGSLRTLESRLGLARPVSRRRRSRVYDEHAAIELRCDPALVEPPAAQPLRAAPRPLQLTDPRLARARSFGAWGELVSTGVQDEPPPREPTAPATPPVREPRYSVREDEAAAAAFDLDAELPPAEPIMAESRSADAGEFLTRAILEAPTPGPVAAQAAPFQDADEEEPSVVPPAPSQTSYGHEIFDQMAANAEQFDLGAVALDLEAAFDSFDLAGERAEAAAAARTRPLEVTDDIDAMADLAQIDEPEEAEEAEPEEEAEEAEELSGEALQSFDVTYDVPLVPQQTGMSCWAAAAAMIVAWRDQMSVDPGAIANAVGYWEQYQNGLNAEDTTMLKVWGLVPEPAQTYTVQGFRELLERWGPLWVASAEPGAHVRVVSGLSGDGTPDGTVVHVLDPWEPGMAAFALPNAGGRYTETYAEFERKQAALARRESNLQGIYVAHADRDRSNR